MSIAEAVELRSHPTSEGVGLSRLWRALRKCRCAANWVRYRGGSRTAFSSHCGGGGIIPPAAGSAEVPLRGDLGPLSRGQSNCVLIPLRRGWDYPACGGLCGSAAARQIGPLLRGQSNCVLIPHRRGWDSNPRNIAVQRFSRPPHSTTLPPLLFFGSSDGAAGSSSRSWCARLGGDSRKSDRKSGGWRT